MNNMQFGQGNDILRFIINNGMININDVQNNMEAMKREELLKKHSYKIWEGKDGKWYTYIPDEEKGRVLKKKATKKSIEDDVIKYWKEETENPTISELFYEWINSIVNRLKLISGNCEYVFWDSINGKNIRA